MQHAMASSALVCRALASGGGRGGGRHDSHRLRIVSYTIPAVARQRCGTFALSAAVLLLPCQVDPALASPELGDGGPVGKWKKGVVIIVLFVCSSRLRDQTGWMDGWTNTCIDCLLTRLMSFVIGSFPPWPAPAACRVPDASTQAERQVRHGVLQQTDGRLLRKTRHLR